MEISKVTLKVIENLSKLTEKEFLFKYSCTKAKYLKRLVKYGDPYMRAPLAKIGKFLIKLIRA